MFIKTARLHDIYVKIVYHDGEKFVAMKSVAKQMGLRWSGQHQKIKDQKDRFRYRLIYVRANNDTVVKTVCIPLECFNDWLISINLKKVKIDLQRKISIYQSEVLSFCNNINTHIIVKRVCVDQF